MIFLSHTLNPTTPTYGNRNKFEIVKTSDISKGNVANDSTITSTVHIGTHIDMPNHFYEHGQTIMDFDDNFWLFTNPLIISIEPKDLIIYDEVIEKLHSIPSDNYDLLIVKTGIEKQRGTDSFWSHNFGFHPDLYDYIKESFPSIRVLGFDSISVSSFAHRMIGREAHKKFLNPESPILLLEDMKLENISELSEFEKIIISPLRIENCDGLPCTVIGLLND